MMSAVCLLSADCKPWLRIWLSFEIEPKYIMTRELKFYFKWADVIVVREWLIWAHSQTRQVFRVYYKKQGRDSQEKKY